VRSEQGRWPRKSAKSAKGKGGVCTRFSLFARLSPSLILAAFEFFAAIPFSHSSLLDSLLQFFSVAFRLDLRMISIPMRHTISVLVENRFGVLARVAGMFSGRGFNIDSLNVAPTNDPSTSRMTIVVRGDDTVLEQVTKQLNKLVDVIEIQDFRDGGFVDRELVMLRVNANSETRSEVMQICDIFRAKIVDVQPTKLAIEITGNESKITKFLRLMENFGLSDLTRTGRVAMARVE
jgi:acetolactate synthase I/III small subunit